MLKGPTKQHSWSGNSNTGYNVPPNSLAFGDFLTQATVSERTVQPRGTLWPKLQRPTLQPKLRGTLTQATLSHQAKMHTQTQAAAVQLRGTLLPRLQCPTQQSSQGGYSEPGYSVPPYNRAKGATLTQAILSHEAKVYTLNPGCSSLAKGDPLTQDTVSHPTV